MRPLSASEAISPALERTKDVLARPFRLGTYLKLAALACLAELGGLNFNSSSGRNNLHSLPPAFLAFMVAFAVVIAVVGLILGLIFLYLGSRLQLVMVELVATRQKIVGPIWRRVGPATWRWLGLRLLLIVSIVAIAIMVFTPLAIWLGISFHHGFHHPAFSITAIFLLVAALLVFVLVFIAVYMSLRDFALPSIALEDTSISEALRRVRGLIGAEPGPVALFLFLQLLLTMVGALMAEMVIAIVLVLSLLPFAVVGGILWFTLHNSGAGAAAVLIAAAVVGAVIYVPWAFCVIVAGIGPVHIFSQAYSLYFLGGRYPLLGDLLDRSAFGPVGLYSAMPLYPPPQAVPPPEPLGG